MNLIEESELGIIWWESLEQQYGLTGETLYRYLVLRSFVEHIKKGRMVNPLKDDVSPHLASFLMKELDMQDGEMVFIGDTSFPIPLRGLSGLSQMTADWHTQYTFLLERGQFEREIEYDWTSYMKEVKRKMKKWSKQAFYEIALKQAYLRKLNESFSIENEYETIPLNGVAFNQEKSPVRLELQLERLLHPYFLQHNESSLVDEKSIEDYLALHLEEVEEGLRLIGRQIVLERGRIDLLARDGQGNVVVIEVKVATDTDLVWQQAYYTKEIEGRYGGDVRFMVIAPKWEPHIMELLLRHPRTDIKIFTPIVKQREIQALEFNGQYAS